MREKSHSYGTNQTFDKLKEVGEKFHFFNPSCHSQFSPAPSHVCEIMFDNRKYKKLCVKLKREKRKWHLKKTELNLSHVTEFAHIQRQKKQCWQDYAHALEEAQKNEEPMDQFQVRQEQAPVIGQEDDNTYKEKMLNNDSKDEPTPNEERKKSRVTYGYNSEVETDNVTTDAEEEPVTVEPRKKVPRFNWRHMVIDDDTVSKVSWVVLSKELYPTSGDRNIIDMRKSVRDRLTEEDDTREREDFMDEVTIENLKLILENIVLNSKATGPFKKATMAFLTHDFPKLMEYVQEDFRICA